MKKITVVLVSLILALSLVACGSTDSKPAGEVNVNNFPEAQEFSEFTWPEFGLSEKIPVPTWSNRGDILWDTDSYFSVDVGYSTKVDFDSYIKSCYDAGFSVDYFNHETIIGDLYTASNADGYSISVCYRAKNVMSIQITAPGSEAQ